MATTFNVAELVWAKKMFCLTVMTAKDNKVFKLNWTCSWNNNCRKAWQTPAWETCKWISKDGYKSANGHILKSVHLALIYFPTIFTSGQHSWLHQNPPHPHPPTHPPPPPPPPPPHVQFLPLVNWTVYHISRSGSCPCVQSVLLSLGNPLLYLDPIRV